MEIDAQTRRQLAAGVITQREAAARLGIAVRTLQRSLHPDLAERDRAFARAYKRRQRGTCTRCGAETRYNGQTVNGPSEFCIPCGKDVQRERMAEIRGTGPFQKQILDLLASRPHGYMEIVRELDTYKGKVSATLDKLLRYGIVYRPKRGVYALSDREPR